MAINIIEISKNEHDQVVNAANSYGPEFVNTHDLVVFCWSFLSSVKPDAFTFTLFLSQFQKSITLSFLSAIRDHEVQFNLMLRQALEAAALGGYALHNPNVDDFGKPDADNCLFVNTKIMEKAYRWLDKEYPKHSHSMKQMKMQINESYAHSSILSASDNIQYKANKIGSIFFDRHDQLITRQHLWWVSNVVIGVLDLLGQIIARYPLVELVLNFSEKMKIYVNENIRIQKELMNNPRFSKWINK